LFYIVAQSIEPFFPDLPVPFRPFGHLFQRTSLDSTPSPLRIPPLRDQARALQYTQVFRDGGHTHVKRRREFANGAFA